MLSPYLGFEGRDIAGVYVVASAAQSGLAMGLLSSDSTPLSAGIYGQSYGSVAPVSLVTSSGPIRETGWLLQPVTQDGPSVFSVLASIYDESVAQGQTAAIVLPKSGAQVATDQFVASGTGAITLGSTALDTICGIFQGQPRVLQSGDVARLQFKGQATQRTVALGIFQLL